MKMLLCKRPLLLQDVSSIGCYLWDTTLLFAQQQDNRELSRQLSLLQVSPQSMLCRLDHSMHVQPGVPLTDYSI